jgi:hypothetical protein
MHPLYSKADGLSQVAIGAAIEVDHQLSRVETDRWAGAFDPAGR